MIPAATELIRNKFPDHDGVFVLRNVEEFMIEFAKLHRVAILQAASETKIPPQWYGESDSRLRNYDDKNTILNSYSENLIR